MERLKRTQLIKMVILAVDHYNEDQDHLILVVMLLLIKATMSQLPEERELSYSPMHIYRKALNTF